MPFNISKHSLVSSESPEALFRDLKTRKIPDLLSYQADILRKYIEESLNQSDVAFQLPTGSGKTLVGLLLGEWRRRKFGERVVYLCPTNQLVYQVADQAVNKYGIKVQAFTGSKSEYESSAKTDYQNADLLAITSYSSLFNVKPFFENPHLIILDDAHAAESYIAGQWSLRIDRFRDDHKELFSVVCNILKRVISQTDFQRMTEKSQDYWDIGWVDKIPTPYFFDLIPEISDAIDTYASQSDLTFSWRLLKDHLSACHLYYSTREILIRPLLPPTNTHPAFWNAKQRVYMSATLGEGGDLERITGRKSINRLKVSSGWDKQGIGRRLFMFPEKSLNEAESEKIMLDMVKLAGRALVLVPDDITAKEVRKLISEKLDITTFDAREIEHSKTPFLSVDKAVAIVANRYDGIDFPDDECRLLIAHGLPRATNLQERFIITRMGAAALLNDRIITRVVQAFGRCTRSATDYAAVIIRGEELNTFLMTRERRTFLHPELQAELDFGIAQSKERKAEDFLDNLRIFFARDDEWNEADEAIVSSRHSYNQEKLPGLSELSDIVEFEIEYQNAMWRGDFNSALEETRKILAKITHNDLMGYRAVWNYLAGSSAWLAAKEGTGGGFNISQEYFSTAMKSTGTIKWLVGLARMRITPQVEEFEDNSNILSLIERMELVIQDLGLQNDRKFNQEEQYILENLSAGNGKDFELAQVKLGRLLGFEAGKKETQGSPDPWWIVNENLCFIFEDHADADVKSSLHVSKARQVSTHPNWVRENLSLSPEAYIIPVLVSPVTSADHDALPHLKEVCYWNIEDFISWATNSLRMIRDLRRDFPGSGDLIWKADAITKYKHYQVSPELLVDYLIKRNAFEILSSK